MVKYGPTSFPSDSTVRGHSVPMQSSPFRTAKVPRVFFSRKKTCGQSAAEKPRELLAALAGSHSLVTAWDASRL